MHIVGVLAIVRSPLVLYVGIPDAAVADDVLHPFVRVRALIFGKGVRVDAMSRIMRDVEGRHHSGRVGIMIGLPSPVPSVTEHSIISSGSIGGRLVDLVSQMLQRLRIAHGPISRRSSQLL